MRGDPIWQFQKCFQSGQLAVPKILDICAAFCSANHSTQRDGYGVDEFVLSRPIQTRVCHFSKMVLNLFQRFLRISYLLRDTLFYLIFDAIALLGRNGSGSEVVK